MFDFMKLVPPVLDFRHKAPVTEVVFTPSRILQEIMRAIPPDAGLITATGRSKLEEHQGLAIYKEMSLDTQVKAALSVKEAAIKTARWSVRPYDDSDAAAKQAEMVTYMLQGMLGQQGIGFDPVLKAYRYGRSDSEMYYELLKFGPYAGKYAPQKLKGKNPGFVTYNLDPYDNILDFRITNLFGADKTVARDRLVHYSYDAENENPYGSSDLTCCYPWWWAKKTLYKYLLIFSDKYASPVPVVTVEKPLTAADEGKLDESCKNYHISNFLKLPKGVSLEMFQNNGTAGSVYILAIREADSQMARGIFSNTLTIGENNKTGTHAQAKVHAGTLKQILISNMLDLEEKVANDQIIRRIVDVNEPNPQGYCTFHFNTLDTGDLSEMATAIGLLVNMQDDLGNPVVHCQEDWVRDVMQIPARDFKKFPLNKTLPAHLDPNFGKIPGDQQVKLAGDKKKSAVKPPNK